MYYYLGLGSLVDTISWKFLCLVKRVHHVAIDEKLQPWNCIMVQSQAS